MPELSWEKLLSEVRRKDLYEVGGENTGTAGHRVEAERDYDRILFASPTRRLADKTQVFPLDSNDSVRTRLTHSYEVSNLCRSIGITLAFNYPEKVFGENHEKLQVKRKVPAILAAIGLAHDLGNPPYGHQGEEAVRNWFLSLSNSVGGGEQVPEDFQQFDGNPQTLRLLTRLQILNDDFGYNLTLGTLAALIKYPCFCRSKSDHGYKKFGIFESEKTIAKEIWKETGLAEGVRHPLTYIMEACDDIAYLVLDAEDTVRKGLASFADLVDALNSCEYRDDAIVKEVRDFSVEKNTTYKKEGLSSAELNEISMQMFRVKAIHHMVNSVVNVYVNKIGNIMNGSLNPGFQLIKHSAAGPLCSILKEFDVRYGYQNKQVLELELKGKNTITETMDLLWSAITCRNTAFSKYAWVLLSENYRRAHGKSIESFMYKNCQLLADSISGMTDTYVFNINRKLRDLYRK
ncbi:dNTP triphosphohydrolase [Saccharophagus sp. K07]|jgi:dGTPase|uniref:dGTP triphosphohydrolase n=1 Tax=Saccharophagus sp. K07 TaxID=2283636 RepID=UPI001652AC13|nr:dNTP triphosphohydrolase [Saccharophagus sp. K07]MBC6906714.1 dNTP triphosphohydrolase [Saccharophagus sp. K07]